MSIGFSLLAFTTLVIPGLVPGIQPTTSAVACGTMDPGDLRNNKHRDDDCVGV
jgi:hypothetical protein